MCGLLGASGKIDPARIRTLGCLNASRGTDSAGIGWVSDMPHLSKGVGHPVTVFNLGLGGDLATACATGQIIGHTRAATTGSVTAENAHPFLIDGVLFAHNGIISNHAQFGTYPVDSQSLIHGIKKMDFSEYQGPVALLWLIGQKMFAYRKGNPLHRGTFEGGLYLSSEAETLKAIGCSKVKELKEGIAYMISGGKIEDVIRVKPNKTFSGGTYGVNGYGNYGEWHRERNWWQESVYDNDSRTIKENDTDMCYCDHQAVAHNKFNTPRTGWACYEKSPTGGTCLCNRFMKKTMSSYKPQRCACGHSTVNHQWSSSHKVCQEAKCPCADFTVEKDPVKFEADDLCDCGHEYEYHDEKETFAPCNVHQDGIICGCTVFYPVEEYALPVRGWHHDIY